MKGPGSLIAFSSIEQFLAEHAAAVHPVTREIIAGGRRFSAVDTFAALHRLETLKRRVAQVLREVDALVLPTTPTTYTVAAVLDDPVELNRRLGYYTNFVNLLDLAAIAVPSGFRSDGLPLGLSIIGPAFHDAALATLGTRFLDALNLPAGAGSVVVANDPSRLPVVDGHHTVSVAVVGLHLSGQAKNSELLALGASFDRAATTTPEYRLVVLPDLRPTRPGLMRTATADGAAIEAEVWNVPSRMLGQLVAGVPPPLTIGTVSLADGTQVKGFLCEEYATSGCHDISALGGWRAYADRSPAFAGRIPDPR